CVDDAGPGSDMEGVARAGAEGPVAGGRESGLRAGGGGPAFLGVRCGHPAGAGGPGVARAAPDLDCADGGDCPDHTHWVGSDAVQYIAIRQSVRVRLSLPVDWSPSTDAAIIQSALSMVQFPGLFPGASALEQSVSLCT